MLSLKLSNILNKKPAMSHSNSQESLVLSPIYPILPKTPQRAFFPDKKLQGSKALIIRQVPNLRPYQFTPACSLIEKAKPKPETAQIRNTKQDLLNITDSFQYRCEGLLEDAVVATHTISKVRRKSDVSSLSGGASAFEKKIGSLMHESLLRRNKKVVEVPKSNTSSPSKLRSSVKRVLAMRDTCRTINLKKTGSTRDLKDMKQNVLNRSNSNLEQNSSLLKQFSIRKEEASQDLIHTVNQSGMELLKLSRLSGMEKENSRDQILEKKGNEGKNETGIKLQKVLKDMKAAKDGNILNQDKKTLIKKNQNKVIIKKMSKSVEKKSITGNKRNVVKAFRIDSQPINLKRKAVETKEEQRKNGDRLNISNNSLDENLEEITGVETVNSKQESIIIDNYSSVGELNEFAVRGLPVIKEEKGVRSQTDKIEKLRKTESKKWIHLNGVQSLVQLSNLGEKRSSSPMFKNYFHLGNKKTTEIKTTSKTTTSLKIDDTEKNIDLAKDTKATRDQPKRNNLKPPKRLFTPKISSSKQIIMTYSLSNVVSPQA